MKSRFLVALLLMFCLLAEAHARTCAEVVGKLPTVVSAVWKSLEFALIRSNQDRSASNSNLAWDSVSIFNNQTGKKVVLSAEELFEAASLQSLAHSGYGVVDLKISEDGKYLAVLVVRDWTEIDLRDKFVQNQYSTHRASLVVLQVEDLFSIEPGAHGSKHFTSFEAAICARYEVPLSRSSDVELEVKSVRVSKFGDFFVHVKTTQWFSPQAATTKSQKYTFRPE